MRSKNWTPTRRCVFSDVVPISVIAEKVAEQFRSNKVNRKVQKVSFDGNDITAEVATTIGLHQFNSFIDGLLVGAKLHENSR